MNNANENSKNNDQSKEIETPELVEISKRAQWHPKWLLLNTIKWLWGFATKDWKHVAAISILLLGIFGVLFIYRGYIQPTIYELRGYSYFVTLVPLILLIIRWVWRKLSPSKVKRGALAGFLLLITSYFVMVGMNPVSYIGLSLQHAFLPKADLTDIPLTGCVRLAPFNSVYALASATTDDEIVPTTPDFVVDRDGNCKWTMSLGPESDGLKLVYKVNEVIELDASKTLEFSYAEHEKVLFEVGENLGGWKQANIAVNARFGLWRFINYKSTNVFNVRDDNGEWVQVVSLMRWSNNPLSWFFPFHEFGGVMVIRQIESGDHLAGMRNFFLGSGEWIPPQEIQNHEFLAGQNILPYDLSRIYAASYRYKNGFFAPWPGIHFRDIRLPVLTQDMNQQPYAGSFHSFLHPEMSDKLYQPFILEPHNSDKSGLNVSVYVPGDGIGPIASYRHADNNENLIGITMVEPLVRAAEREIDWSTNGGIESRMYNKELSGRRRVCYLTSVVTFETAIDRSQNPQQTDGSDKIISEDDTNRQKTVSESNPDNFITCADTTQSIWIDPSLDIEDWPEMLEKAYAYLWER